MNQAEAEGLAAILQLFGWGLFGWILFNSPRVWARSWLIAARGVLSGLWRSVAPFHSSAPALGPPRPAQGAWGTVSSEPPTEVEEPKPARSTEGLPGKIQGIEDQLIREFGTPNPVVGRRVTCLYCMETVTEICLPHGCEKELQGRRGGWSGAGPTPWVPLPPLPCEWEESS